MIGRIGIIVILVTNLLLYFVVGQSYFQLGADVPLRTLMFLCYLVAHSLQTYLSFQILRFYLKNGRDLVYSKKLYYLMVLMQILILLSGFTRKESFYPLMLGNVLIFQILLIHQIFVGEEYIYYKGEVIARDDLKKADPDAKPVIYKGTVLYQYKKKGKVKYIMIKESYVPCFYSRNSYYRKDTI